MANRVGDVSNAQHAAQVNQAATKAKQEAPSKTAAPKDTVNISAAGRAASQTQKVNQTESTSSDAHHEGGGK